jgi:hypothetical protein
VVKMRSFPDPDPQHCLQATVTFSCMNFYRMLVICSVVDPKLFMTDPDPTLSYQQQDKKNCLSIFTHKKNVFLAFGSGILKNGQFDS